MRGVRCIPVLVLLGAVLAGSAAPARAQGERDTLRILFTHDTHDHWYPTESEGGAYGGYTRLATLLRQEREAFPSGEGQALVTLDAGDFSMGSLLQTIYSTDAPELRERGDPPRHRGGQLPPPGERHGELGGLGELRRHRLYRHRAGPLRRRGPPAHRGVRRDGGGGRLQRAHVRHGV